MSKYSRPIDQVVFHNSFVEELRGEASADKRPRQVPGYCYSRVEPTPVQEPLLLAWSEDLAHHLGLAEPEKRGSAVDVLAGNLVTPSMKPFAARYAGHQFGSWAGQLGDGRAISLGEVEALDGSFWEIQLKGAGPTPYSRRADGRAVLRSSLREFLCSEAMYYLGVPTTRALSLVATGDSVMRDMFYNGNARPEQGAIVARVAPTFIRFGNFEMMAANSEIENLRALAHYVIRHHYADLIPESLRGSLVEGETVLPDAVYLQWFVEICRRTAVMIAHWMSVGFVHGVMNTDNMSILGLTIDYGPYGWLEPYDPDWTPNTTDFGQHRYAFGQQPRVALWNLLQLGRTLVPLVSNREELNQGLDCYRTTLAQVQQEMMLKKLGLTPEAVQQGTTSEPDARLIEELQQCLIECELDMTLFFRYLSHAANILVSDQASGSGDKAGETAFNTNPLTKSLLEATSYLDDKKDLDQAKTAAYQNLQQWLHRYAHRLQQEPAPIACIQERMLRVNPKYVLRNYLAQRAIEGAEVGDLSFLHTLMKVLKTPYDEQPEYDDLAAKRPEWARNKPGCATLSCSS